jgi:hypothetical protein
MRIMEEDQGRRNILAESFKAALLNSRNIKSGQAIEVAVFKDHVP